MRDFRELKVWQKVHELTLAIYQETVRFPRTETYGLTSQLRRAAVSIGANVEGSGKNSHPDFARFLLIALGSASEVEYELLLAHDLGYVNSAVYNQLSQNVIEIKRMLARFVQYLNGRRTGTAG